MATKKKAVTKKKVARKKVATKKAVAPKKLAYLEGKIKVLSKENPKREGSASHKMFKLYTKHTTVGSFLKAGGTQVALNWDQDKGFIKFIPFRDY